MCYKLKQHENAVSSIIGWFLVLIILSTATAAIIFSTIQPINEIKTKSVTDVVADAFEGFDINIANSLSSTSVPKKLEISVDKGTLEVDPIGDRIAIMYTYSDEFDFTFITSDVLEHINLEDDVEVIDISLGSLITWAHPTWTDTLHVDYYPDLSTGIDNDIDVQKFNSDTCLLIQLRDPEYPLDTSDDPDNHADDDPAHEKVPFGCIWIFDLGRITYDSYNPTGEELGSLTGGQSSKVIYENRGVLRDSPNSRYVQLAKNIINNEDSIIQLNLGLIRGNPISVSGGGVYQLDFQLLNYDVLTQVNTIVYNLKIQISGKYQQEWYDYLKANLITYNTFEPESATTLLFNSGQQTNLVLSDFVVKINNINIK